ncbi:MAG: hypothetical protein IJU84_01090 [Clostridia bacterium]|nr:hypothetical protein [Clostridia bacterium]
MKVKPLKTGMDFEDDTCYVFHGETFEVTKKNTVKIRDKRYFCTESTYSDHHDTAFFIEGKKNVTIDFGGATLLLRGAIQPFIFSGCENFTLKNVTIRYDRSYVTEMVVTETGEGYFKAKIGDKFPCIIEGGKIMPYGTGWIEKTIHEAPVFLQEFDKDTGRGVSWPVVSIGSGKDSVTLGWGDVVCGFSAERQGDEVLFKGKRVPPYKKGNVLALTSGNRDISAVTVYDCKDAHISDCRIINGLGMGILPFYTENIYIDGLKMFCDEKSDGLISNAADGIHAVACYGKFVLKNSVIEGTIDDALNIHGNYFTFVSAEGNAMTVKNAGKINAENKVFGKGDRIRLHRGHTLDSGGEYRITEIEHIQDKLYKFILDRLVGAHAEGDLVENLSAQPEIYISDCRFAKANTHLRFQSGKKTVIENCESELDMLFTGDTNYWFESSPVKDVTIENVRFLRETAGVVSIPEFRSSEKSPYYHSGIVVKNCFFQSKNAVYARYTGLIGFYGNRTEDGKFFVKLDNCGDFDTDCDVEITRVSEKLPRDE